MSWRAAFVYDSLLSQHVLRADHPLRPLRLQYTYELLEAYGAFQCPGVQLIPPRQAIQEELLTFHTPDYVLAVSALSRGLSLVDPARYNFSQWGDNPAYPGMYEAALWSTGASLVAAELVVSGQADAAFNISGGLHHAAAGNASGFCVFNDPVVAIKALQAGGLRVAYVDIDAHHGDGVQAAFYTTDQVLTISLHESGQFLFPGTGAAQEVGEGAGQGYAVNVPLFPYTGDEVYLWALEQVVPPLIRAFQPDVLVTQLGIDTHFNDPLTHLRLTVQGHSRATALLGGLCPRWVALGGGGYDPWAVARAWTLDFGVMLGVEWPDAIPDAYQKRYGVTALRDPEGPKVEEDLRERTWQFAREQVRWLQEHLFPIHGLSPG